MQSFGNQRKISICVVDNGCGLYSDARKNLNTLGVGWQMFIVVEVDPSVDEIQFAHELHVVLIYNSCIDDLWRVIVQIPETDVVLNCFVGQDWFKVVFNIDLIPKTVFYSKGSYKRGGCIFSCTTHCSAQVEHV